MAGSAVGGAEEFFVRLACGFQRAGIDQFCAIRPNEARNQILQAAGVPFAELPFGGRFDLRTPFGLRRLVKQHKPKIVLTWMNRASRMMPTGDYVRVARLGGYYKLKNFRNFDHLIGNTHDIVDYIVKNGWPAERAHYLPNFVDAMVAGPLDRALFDTPDNVPLVLGLGRLHESKGFDNLIRAFRKVPDAYLWIAGSGDLKKDLQQLARDEGIENRVRFLGWRRDVAALFATCDVFCASSRYEPLGNMVIEAWAHDCPVVAQASQGPLQLIEQGETGLLSPLEDIDALAADLSEVIHDRALQQRLTVNGRSAFETQFTEQIVVRCYKEFFDGIVG